MDGELRRRESIITSDAESILEHATWTGQLTERPMAQADVYQMIRRRRLAAGIGTQIGCHSFRATGITTYVQNGGKAALKRRTRKADNGCAMTKHPAHTRTAGPDADSHYHASKRAEGGGKKKLKGHAFKDKAPIVIPLATAGVSLFGDNDVSVRR